LIPCQIAEDSGTRWHKEELALTRDKAIIHVIWLTSVYLKADESFDFVRVRNMRMLVSTSFKRANDGNDAKAHLEILPADKIYFRNLKFGTDERAREILFSPPATRFGRMGHL
jgi:hypothetical protein